MQKCKCKAIKQDGSICGYKWRPRIDNPVMCPACKSRKWKGGDNENKRSKNDIEPDS